MRDDSDKRMMRIVGTRIANARERMGLSQVELARELGHSQSWLQRIEGGINSVYIYDLVDIARVLETPIEWFINPDYKARLGKAPVTREEWEALYDGDPLIAETHYRIDELARRHGQHGPLALSK